MTRRVLFISYPFPPVGGAGVQRATKFVKYLPQFGWEPSVLTVLNPSVPVVDESLQRDIPPQTVVRRGRTLEPGYAVKAIVSAGGGGGESGERAARKAGVGGVVKSAMRRVASAALQPDAQILWAPGALKEGKKLIDETAFDAVLASGPPFSSFLIAARLSRYGHLPLVLDYRDEWDISNTYLENKRLDPVSLAIQKRMQRYVVRRADALVATTGHSARALQAVCADAGSLAEVTWIYNGFDPDDFHFHDASATDAPANEADAYRVVYTGTLWNLTDVSPLVEAARLLAERDPRLASRLELVFAGRRTEAQQRLLSTLRGLPCRVTEHAYLAHDAAVGLLRSASALCVLLADVPAASRVVPAKVFEYMATGRPILAIAPSGEVRDVLLSQYPAAATFSPKAVPDIMSWLAQKIADRTAGVAASNPVGFDPSVFSRRAQAGQLAGLLESLAAKRGTKGGGR